MSESVKHSFVSGKADGVDATLVRPSNWNEAHVLRTELTNKSGLTVNNGDVLIATYATEEGFSTTNTIGASRPVAIAGASITDNNTGNFTLRGICDVVNVQGAVTIGDYLRTSATAGRAEAIPGALKAGHPAGAFGIAMTAFAGPGSGTVKALLFGLTYGQLGYKGPDSASSGALSVDVSADFVHVTGTTTITSLPTRVAGAKIILQFDSNLIVQHGAGSLILADGVDFFVKSGTVMGFVSEGSAWREIFRSTTAFNPRIKSLFFDDFMGANGGGGAGTIFTGDKTWKTDTGVSVTDEIGGVVTIGQAVQLYNPNTAGNIHLTFQSTKKTYLLMRVAQATTNVDTRRFGLMDTTTGGDPTNGMFFRHTNGGTISAVCRNGGAETTLSTGIAAVAGTYHTFELVCDGSGNVSVIVDNVVKGTISTNVPTSLLGVNLMNGVFVDYVHVEQLR